MLKYLLIILFDMIEASFLGFLFWRVVIRFQQGNLVGASMIFGVLIFGYLFIESINYISLREDN